MLLDVFDTIVEALKRWSNAIGLGWIVVIATTLALLTIVVSFVCTQLSIERKTAKAVEKLNHYLEKNPFITEENLVEFNKLMKHIPKQMRAQWQHFMINRDKKASEFFTDDNCIDKPFKASSYSNHIVAVKTFMIAVAVLSFVFGLAYYTSPSTDLTFSYQTLLSSLIVPAGVVIISEIYTMFLKTRKNNLVSDLYFDFDKLRKNLDRAVTTLPDYIDYEILFTRKEITAGIPVLQEYLEQRARFEQEQIKKAKESEVVHEDYDFSALGVNGGLVMERAMRECEFFLGNKKRILAEISEIESSRDMLDKNYDEKNKTSQRKLRDIRESLDRLKEKLDATTNLIVGNDLRKQRENEIQKQRQLEKEADEDNKKYEEEKKKLNEQVEAKRAEIEEFRKSVETSLNTEFRTYADKIYVDLQKMTDEKSKDYVDGLNAEIVSFQQNIEEKERVLVEKNSIVLEKDQRIAELEQFIRENELVENAKEINAKNKEIFSIKKDLESRKIELEKKNKQIQNQKEIIDDFKRKNNMDGELLQRDENGNLYFVDEEGNKNIVTTELAEFEIERPAVEIEEPKEIEIPEIGEEVIIAPQPEEMAEEEESDEIPSLTPNNEFEETNVDLGFEDNDLLTKDTAETEEEKQPEQPEEKPAEPDETTEPAEPVEPVEPVEEPVEPVEEVTEEPEAVVAEEEEQQEQPQEIETEFELPAEEQIAEEAQETQEENAEVEEDEIEKLEKMIQEQNEELEKQNQNLSKQLEETQKVAEEKAEAPAKKPVSKTAKKHIAGKTHAAKKPLAKGAKPSANKTKVSAKSKLAHSGKKPLHSKLPNKAKKAEPKGDTAKININFDNLNKKLNSKKK